MIGTIHGVWSFSSLFKMTKQTFNKINCDELNKYYFGGGQPIVAEKQLMMSEKIYIYLIW